MEILRQPYIERRIRDISKDDNSVAVSGVVVSKSNDSFIIDDGNGQIQVFYDSLDVKDDAYIRVFGKVLPDGKIQGEIIQDLSKIDKNLHKKVINLLK